jgi:hypothetical protein
MSLLYCPRVLVLLAVNSSTQGYGVEAADTEVYHVWLRDIGTIFLSARRAFFTCLSHIAAVLPLSRLEYSIGRLDRRTSIPRSREYA